MTTSPPTIITQKGAANLQVNVEEAGVGLVIRNGGQPGGRIFFDRRSEEIPGANSIEMVEGTALLRRFNRLELVWPAQVLGTTLELEIFTCATPVYVLGNEPQGSGAKLVLRYSDTIVSETTGFVVYAESTLTDAGELELDAWRYRRERWIGGAIVATQPVTLRAWQRITPTLRAQMGDLRVTVTDTDGNYSASLETGWARRYDTFGTNIQTHMHGPLMPWPRGGLEFTIDVPGVTDADIDLMVYARS